MILLHARKTWSGTIYKNFTWQKSFGNPSRSLIRQKVWRRPLSFVSTVCLLGYCITSLLAGTLPVVHAGKSSSGDDHKPCYCTSFRCNGGLISLRSRKRHQREDKQRVELSIAKEQLYQSTRRPSSSPSVDNVIKQLVPFFFTFATHPSSSKVGLSEQLYNTHHNILTKPNNFPESYSKALTLIRPYLIKQDQYVVCPNDCQFFHHNTQTECSFCNSSSKNPKRFRKMPLKDRLIRMYGTHNLAHIVQATHLNRNADVLTDIHDTDDWANWFSANGIFAGDSRGLVFGFCTDGMDPFAHHNSKTYSMWPIVLCLYNLPKEFRMSPAFLFLWGIVPPRPHGKEPNIDIYMELLVSELIELTEYPVYDSYRRAPFTLKVRLLRFILDFPGISNVFHMVGNNGIRACHWCSLKGCRCEDVPKTVYLDNRAYLYRNHPIHNDKSFPYADSGQQPEPISLSYALSSRAKYTHAKTKRERNEVAKETGFKGVYPMIRLPDHDIHEQSWPDPMHTLKNVNSHILRLLASTDKPGGNDHWTLKTDELKRADERAQKVRFPPGFGLSAGRFFGNTGKSIADSHGHKQFAVTSVIQFCLRGALGSAQRKTLFNFYGVLSELYAETHPKLELPGLLTRVNEALALLERDFPSHLQNITTHILRHIADSLHRFGPVYSSWMYPFERFNSWIHRRASLNRANPEATVMETYAIYDWCIFMIISGQAEPPNNCPEYDTLHLTKFQRYLDECRNGVDLPTKTTNTRHHTEEMSYEEKQIIIKEYSQQYCIFPNDISITSEISIFNRLQILCPLTKRPIQFNSSDDNYSIVHVIIGDIPKFGKVSTLFTHIYKDTVHQWAKIDWLPEPELDQETQLWHTSPDPVFQTCVPLAALSKPHVSAVDEGRLWILSQSRYPQKRYFFDSSHLCLS